jgi:catechol 2,3-dioxygenase-like lactoylglutathione lyase family enzyme
MIKHLDHLVLTTTDFDACAAFYVDGLGMRLNLIEISEYR